jgi:hypothetical protein
MKKVFLFFAVAAMFAACAPKAAEKAPEAEIIIEDVDVAEVDAALTDTIVLETPAE